MRRGLRVSHALLVLFIMLGLFSTSPFVAACSCAGPMSVGAALEHADAVFSGRVVRIEGEVGGYEPVLVTFQAYEVWKGEVGEEVSVGTMGQEATCGYTFQVGEEYLVYAHSDEEYKDFYGVGLETGLCTRNTMLSQAQGDIVQLNFITNLPLLLLGAMIVLIAAGVVVLRLRKS